MLLEAEALDAAHHEAGLHLVAGIDLAQRVDQEAAVGTVTLAEVGR
jgi:hypothetical protein